MCNSGQMSAVWKGDPESTRVAANSDGGQSVPLGDGGKFSKAKSQAS